MGLRTDKGRLLPHHAAGLALSAFLTLQGAAALAQSPVTRSMAPGTAAGGIEAADPSGMTQDGVDQPDGARSADSAADGPAPTASNAETTGSILDRDILRLNTREPVLDERPAARKPRVDPSEEESPGIRLGSFVLRPTVTESINGERRKDGETSTHRVYSETDIGASLTSDWSRHKLTVTGSGALQRNLSGEGSEQPEAKLDADLRLDLADDTLAHVTGFYHFYRQDTQDPEAVADASRQSDVQEFGSGLSVERDYGILRGSAGFDLRRTVYSDAELENGDRLSLSDRNETNGTLTTRLGYELSPALIPFVELSAGRSLYDEKEDAEGYQRSGNNYGAKAGLAVDLGEKLRGELAFGYGTRRFEDDRLDSVDAATVDGSLLWSPQRGTDVRFDLRTSLEPSSIAGIGGYVSHGLTTTVSHALRSNLSATVIGGIVVRDYPTGSGVSDENAYRISSGLTWNMNRYLDLTGTLGYELTSRKSGADSEEWRAGIGLKLKR